MVCATVFLNYLTLTVLLALRINSTSSYQSNLI